MSISVRCGSCGGTFKARDQAAGKRFACPKCGEPIAVPMRFDPPADVSTFVPLERPAPSSSPAPAPISSTREPSPAPASLLGAWRRPLAVVALVCAAAMGGAEWARRSTPAPDPPFKLDPPPPAAERPAPPAPAPVPATAGIRGTAWATMVGGGTTPLPGMVVQLLPREVRAGDAREVLLRIMAYGQAQRFPAVERLVDKGAYASPAEARQDELRAAALADLKRLTAPESADARIAVAELREAVRVLTLGDPGMRNHLQYDLIARDKAWPAARVDLAVADAETRPDGRYAFEGVAPGDYLVAASWTTEDSYVEWLTPATARPGQTIEADLFNTTALMILNFRAR